jgi:prefoldin subunit 4
MSFKLSKEDEATIGNSEDTEVRREDQEKINRFSRLHQRETVLEEKLKGKQVRLSLFFVF